MDRLYTVFVAHADGALRPAVDCSAPTARAALRFYYDVCPDARGPFVVLPALTAAPLLVD